MKIGIFGTGVVGNTIGSKLIELGHSVMMGSRTADNPSALAFAEKHGGNLAYAGTFADAADFGEMLINCTKGEHTIDVLKSAGEGINGKVLIDISNPLEFNHGMPPSLISNLCNTNSLGEEIQKEFPEVKVVKTLNTMWCGLMVNPALISNGDHVNFICGNDQDAKDSVRILLYDFGWKYENLLDLGDISNARGTEALLPIWLRIWGATKNGAFNFKIVS